VLTAALSELSPADRELLLLSGWEELTPTEIATVIGHPTALVRVRLHRARLRLQAKLSAAAADERGRTTPQQAIEPSIGSG